MQPERHLKMVSEWVQQTCELMISEGMDSINLAALIYTHTRVYIPYKHTYYVEHSTISILIQVVPLHVRHVFRLPLRYKHIYVHASTPRFTPCNSTQWINMASCADPYVLFWRFTYRLRYFGHGGIFPLVWNKLLEFIALSSLVPFLTVQSTTVSSPS